MEGRWVTSAPDTFKGYRRMSGHRVSPIPNSSITANDTQRRHRTAIPHLMYAAIPHDQR